MGYTPVSPTPTDGPVVTGVAASRKYWSSPLYMISSQFPKAVGYTHASSVMPIVKSSERESLTSTAELDPLNASAFPKRPVVIHDAPLIVPALPEPEASETIPPAPSSKP